MHRSLERGNAPPRVSVLNDPGAAAAFGWAPVLAETMKTAKLEPREPIWPTWTCNCAAASPPCCSGQKTAKVALDGVAADWQRIVATSRCRPMR